MSPQFRATLHDNDTSRERPLTIYCKTLEDVEQWAAKVLPTAMDGAEVMVYQTIEQQIKIIPKDLNSGKLDAEFVESEKPEEKGKPE